MQMSLRQKYRNAVDAMRDEFGMASAILQYAIRQNIAGFALSGLKIPRVLQTWSRGADLPAPSEFALQVSIFQEHLVDRIAGLAHNRKMLQEIWRFNEVTREFRECELMIPEAARDILDHTADLINALFDQDQPAALESLQHCLDRRMERAEQIVPQLRVHEPLAS
ncbi:hypothetical protein ACUSIJ_26705 [Pseudochelatococcus sp. B33]